MSARKTYHLVCDDCGVTFAPQRPHEHAKTVRAIAHDHHGWTHRLESARNGSGPAPSLDRCAACSQAVGATA